MKRISNALVIVLALLFGLALGAGVNSPTVRAQAQVKEISYAPIPGGEYQLDPAHSTIGFAVRHLEINWVEGRFKDFAGTIRYDDKDITKSSVEFTAKVESIDTGVQNRDNHLRSADFFEVAKYPDLSFKSTRVERTGKAENILHGDLTLKGVTKPVALPFSVTGAIKDGRGNTRIGIQSEAKLNRRDYGINYGKALPSGGFDIGNEITIRLQLEAIQPAPKPTGQ